MYKAYFKLDSNPFSPSPSPEFIFQSKELKEALAHFSFALENREAFLLLTGEVGTGKTTAVQSVLRLLPEGTPVALVTHTTLEPRELLEIIALKFGLIGLEEKTKPVLLRGLEAHFETQWAKGRQSLLILDESHLLKPAVLEEVRLLSNLEREGGKLVQICLVGQPELIARLQQPELRQLRQRISVRYALRPLGEGETREYVVHRLRVAGSPAPNAIFTADALAAIHASTHGIPREINVIAAQSLLNAYLAESPIVGAEHVSTVREDYGFEGLRHVQEPVPEKRAAPPPATRLMKPDEGSLSPPPGVTPRPIPLPPQYLRPAPRTPEAVPMMAGPPPPPAVQKRPQGEPVAVGSGKPPPSSKSGGSNWLPWVLLILVGLFFIWRYWLAPMVAEESEVSPTATIPNQNGASADHGLNDADEGINADSEPGIPVLKDTLSDSTGERLSAQQPEKLEVLFQETRTDTAAASLNGSGEATPRRYLVARSIREGLYHGPLTTQVASFKGKDLANKVLADITARTGLKGLVDFSAVRGDSWYRILVGRFSTVQEAIDALTPLIESRLVTEVMIIPMPSTAAPSLDNESP